jgi:uncharacterized damage-inducible protein DinB
VEFRLDEAVELLRNTPGTLHAMLDGLSDSWTACDEGRDTWSPRDVVGHLIHGEEDDWIPRARVILEQGQAQSFDPFDRVAFKQRIANQTLGELLDDFARLRQRNLEILAELDLGPAQLALQGTHPEFGSVTLAQLIATWVAHDLSHVCQMARTMAKQYDRAVGPWKAYLSILNR